MAKRMKGMTIQGGVAPKGSTKGGGPNGESGLANSETQVMLQRAKVRKLEVTRDKEAQKANKRGPNLTEIRKEKKIAKF